MTQKTQPSFLRILMRLCAAIGAGLIVLRITQDQNVVEKVGTALIMPSGLIWILLLTLSIQLWMQTTQNQLRWSPAAAATCSFCLFSIAGNGFMANRMARALEADYLDVNPMQAVPMDVVIVLGGGSGLGANGRLQGNGSGDRLILAAQLYHQKIAANFICTGQRIGTMNSSGVDPASSSRDILLKLGVPDSAIEMTGGRNTSEEMQGLSQRFQNSTLRIGLLTSAWHLPRAMRLASRNGLKPIPIPADFRTAANVQQLTTGQIVESMIPTGAALGSSWAFAKEYLALLVGR